MESWSIGQVAHRAALRPSAIRYYEAAGLLPKPARRSGRRVYDPSVLQLLALIRLAKQAGFSVAEIRTLRSGFAKSTPPAKRWRTLATRKLEDVREQIERAKAMERVLNQLLECECPTIEACGQAVNHPRGRDTVV